MITFLAALCLGLALAASAGLRAFMPLLAAGVAARVGWIPVGESFQWLQETPALIALAAAVVFEVAGDKVPALDHALDLLQAPVRTAAGALACVAVVTPSAPVWATALLGVVAGGAALSVHATKSFVRLGSTAATAGVANPVVSLFEDLACAAVTVLSLLLWVFAGLIALVALAWMVFGVRKLRRLGRADPAAAACPARDATA
ncbi:MAG: DUF4126 domain-containing protein [Planctomycetes bacterium]|nr:DUF4126 domain-containing protein [Planctomycetota bacterium]